jgi:CHAD domain-containing protein
MTPREASPSAIQESIGDLALDVVRKQVEALRAHEAGTRDGADPEELHDMRVATRRLRAALRSFEAVLPPEAEWLRAELQWLGRSLSTARDLDVQIQQLQNWQKSLSDTDRPAMASLLGVVVAEREQAREPLIKALGSKRYRTLMERADALLTAEPPEAAAEPVATWAPRLVERLYRKLRKAGDKLDGHSPAAELHALRIHGKRLRYLVEFVTPTYGQPADRFARRVVELQDVLGNHQDAHVAVERLREMLGARHETISLELAFLMGELAERYEGIGAEMRREFGGTYSRLTRKPWRRLRKALESASARAEVLRRQQAAAQRAASAAEFLGDHADGHSATPST